MLRRGLFVRLEKSERFVVYDINELSGTIIARYGEDGRRRVRTPCREYARLGWSLLARTIARCR